MAPSAITEKRSLMAGGGMGRSLMAGEGMGRSLMAGEGWAGTKSLVGRQWSW